MPSLKTISNILQQQQKFKPEEIGIWLDQPIVDRAFGCLFGGFIGDALGAYCQFQGEQSDEQVQQIMKMKGGGTYQIKPGQLTDDSQMTLHLLRALTSYTQTQPLHQQIQPLTVQIANQYIYWYKSEPFDIGDTCRKAINIIDMKKRRKSQINYEMLIQECFPMIVERNRESLSNGSLMRVTPLAVFMGLMKKFRMGEGMQAIEQLIRNEVNMTHGNPIISQCTHQWINLLSQLIIRHQQQQLKTIFQQFLQRKCINTEIDQWKHEGLKNQLMKATVNQGYCKIAFSYGVNQFNKIINMEEMTQGVYDKCMRNVLRKGGDSDTNGAIVGGLIGAVVGLKNLPQEYLNKQLALKLPKFPTLQNFDRYQFYQPKTGLKLLTKLLRKFIK